MYLASIRKEELIYLTWNDLSIENDSSAVKIQTKQLASGKHWVPKAKQRCIIPLNARAAEIIRRQPCDNGTNWVFTDKKGRQLSSINLWTIVKRTLCELGLEGDVHKFRHTFASHLTMKGVGI